MAIETKEGNYQDATTHYEKALTLDKTNPIKYIYLGVLYIKVEYDTAKAISIWNQGLSNTSDPNAKMKLTELIQRFSN